MSLLLAIETTVGPFSLALFKDGKLIATYHQQQPHCQAEQLIPSISDILTAHGYEYSDIGAIAASIGPGSFTGIRIGLAAAQGISIALGCPIIGISTLEAIATTGEGDDYMIALNAGRDQFYSQSFSNINGHIHPISPPKLISPEEAAEASIIITNTHDSYPILSAHNVGMQALARMATGGAIDSPSPIYIRDADAKIPSSAKATA